METFALTRHRRTLAGCKIPAASGSPTTSFWLFLAVSGMMWSMGGDDADRNWQRLGSYVVSRRVKLGYRVRGAFAELVGISTRILSDIEKARRRNYDPTTLAQLEQALGWRTGSIDAVLRGADPTVIDEPLHDEPAGERAAVRQIAEVLDTDYSAETKVSMIRDVLARDVPSRQGASSAVA